VEPKTKIGLFGVGFGGKFFVGLPKKTNWDFWGMCPRVSTLNNEKNFLSAFKCCRHNTRQQRAD